jgi:hypothetical protein
MFKSRYHKFLYIKFLQISQSFHVSSQSCAWVNIHNLFSIYQFFFCNWSHYENQIRLIHYGLLIVRTNTTLKHMHLIFLYNMFRPSVPAIIR